MDRIDQVGIDPSRRDPVRKTDRPDHAARRAEDRQRQTPPADQATISDRARLLSRAKQAAEEASDVREDRVRELREAIEKKSYSVDNLDIARRMLGLKDQ